MAHSFTSHEGAAGASLLWACAGSHIGLADDTESIAKVVQSAKGESHPDSFLLPVVLQGAACSGLVCFRVYSAC